MIKKFIFPLTKNELLASKRTHWVLKAGTETPEDSSVKKVRVFERAMKWGFRDRRAASH